MKGDGKAGRWFSPLEKHVLPKLGKVPVSDIDQRDIRDTLAPIWHDKAHTAKKAMNRLGICMRHAAALGLDVDLQVTDKAKTPRDVAETCLAHVAGGKLERAYRRTDFLEQRRVLMERWAASLTQPEAQNSRVIAL